MRKFLFFTLLSLTAVLPGAEIPVLEWVNPGKGGRFFERDGVRCYTLTVSETEKAGQHLASAAIDLTPWKNRPMVFSIRVSGENVSEPPQEWNGVKFMIYYKTADGRVHWRGTNRQRGTFGVCTVSNLLTIPEDAVDGRVMVGLQESSGTVTFELDSFMVAPLFDAGKAAANRYECPYTPRVAERPAGRGVMSPKRFSPGDMEQLEKWNVNLVRFQISRNWRKFQTDRDLQEYDRWLEEMLDHLEEVLAEAEKRRIAVILDLHQPPGGRYPDNNMAMFYEKKYADHFVAVWERIARRFRGNPAVWGFDLINEPLQTRPAAYDYWSLQKRAAEAIRAIDPDVPIIFSANEASAPAAFRYLEPLEMKDVVYQVHLYLPNAFTHQYVFSDPPGKEPKVGYPGMIGDVWWNGERLREELRPVREFQLRHNARIVVGEFSAVIWAPGAGIYLKDCISLFEEFGWNWCYHSFREWQGWSLEHEGEDGGSIRPSADNDRKRVLLDAFRKNRSN